MLGRLGIALSFAVACQGSVPDEGGDDDDSAADAAPPAADADPDAPDASPGQPDATPPDLREQHDFTFANGKFAEPTLSLQSGTRLVMTIAASPGPAFYNIHAHSGGMTTTFVEDEGTDVVYAFEAPSSGSYWVLLGNTSNDGTIDVSLTLDFYGEGSVENWGE